MSERELHTIWFAVAALAYATIMPAAAVAITLACVGGVYALIVEAL